MDIKEMPCPVCGGPMESGFILTKQSRPRWSATEKAVTVFTGTPLTSLPKGFWFSRSAWQAPNMEAVRCPECGLGVFRYDREPRPLPSAKRAAVFVICAIISAAAATYLLMSGLDLLSPAMLAGAALLTLATLLCFAGLFMESV